MMRGEDAGARRGLVDSGALGGAEVEVGIATNDGGRDNGGESEDCERDADCVTNRVTSQY
jgi:hypothetical protein